MGQEQNLASVGAGARFRVAAQPAGWAAGEPPGVFRIGEETGEEDRGVPCDGAAATRRAARRSAGAAAAGGDAGGAEEAEVANESGGGDLGGAEGDGGTGVRANPARARIPAVLGARLGEGAGGVGTGVGHRQHSEVTPALLRIETEEEPGSGFCSRPRRTLSQPPSRRCSHPAEATAMRSVRWISGSAAKEFWGNNSRTGS